MDVIERALAERSPLVLDGGLSTQLELGGRDLGHALWSAHALLEYPDAVAEAHRAFLEAGADILITSSYQVSFEGFAANGLSPTDAERALRASVTIAREVAKASPFPEPLIAEDYDDNGEHLTGSVELCFSTEYAERAFQDAHMERKGATAPFVDGVIPTTLVDGLGDMKNDIHFFSMFTQWVPDDWNTEAHTDELDAYAKRIFDQYEMLAPGFKDQIVDYQVIGPYEMEQKVGLLAGNIFHGELAVDQLFHMRPAVGYADFRTPIKGLYHGSCATHGGGGINGIPGWQAYRQAKKDGMVRNSK